jgi:hypothetical protein
MHEDRLVYTSQLNCNHEKQRLYKQRQFDILNGFELNFTRCINCHKIVNLGAKKFANH